MDATNPETAATGSSMLELLFSSPPTIQRPEVWPPESVNKPLQVLRSVERLPDKGMLPGSFLRTITTRINDLALEHELTVGLGSESEMRVFQSSQPGSENSLVFRILFVQTWQVPVQSEALLLLSCQSPDPTGGLSSHSALARKPQD